MDVLRKKSRNPNSVETESIAADHIIQLSEYKSKFRNPSIKSAVLPTSTTNNVLASKRPRACQHKPPPNVELRPRPSSVSRFRAGEQYLF